MVDIISLGAGVQSSTMALMFARGELSPMPAAAIFADTGDEPQAVYRWLEWLQSLELPFPIIRARRPLTLSENMIAVVSASETEAVVGSYGYVPLFSRKSDGEKGMLRRQCTKNFKINVVQMAARQRFGKGTKFRMLIGISTDEAHRMKPSPVDSIENHYPLIEAGVSRGGCLRWMEERGYPTPPRSACVFCPYKSDSEWKELRRDSPEDFAAAVDFERAVTQGAKGTGVRLYLHSSRKPLDEVDFSDDQMDLFGEECEGMCGL